MPWPVIYRAEWPENPTVGDIWPDNNRDWVGSDQISKKYLEQWADKRPPFMIALPSTCSTPEWVDIFLIDRVPSDKDGEGGWDIVIEGEWIDGQPLNITIAPSIDCKGSYHGHVKQGMVTDDVDGRTYKDKVYG